MLFPNKKFAQLTFWYYSWQEIKTSHWSTENWRLWQVTEWHFLLVQVEIGKVGKATVNFMFSQAVCWMPCGGIMSLPRFVKISHFIEMFRHIW